MGGEGGGEGGVVEKRSGGHLKFHVQSREKSRLPPEMTTAVGPVNFRVRESTAAMPSAPVGSITSFVRYIANFTASSSVSSSTLTTSRTRSRMIAKFR